MERGKNSQAFVISAEDVAILGNREWVEWAEWTMGMALLQLKSNAGNAMEVGEDSQVIARAAAEEVLWWLQHRQINAKDAMGVAGSMLQIAIFATGAGGPWDVHDQIAMNLWILDVFNIWWSKW